MTPTDPLNLKQVGGLLGIRGLAIRSLNPIGVISIGPDKVSRGRDVFPDGPGGGVVAGGAVVWTGNNVELACLVLV